MLVTSSSNPAPIEPILEKSTLVQPISLNGTSKFGESIQPIIQGKFIYVGEKKFYIRGISYGAFEPNEKGDEYYDLEKIDDDFSLMIKYGFNTVRIPHTTPPKSLLDIAHKYGLKVMVSLSAEQYTGYLIDKHKKINLGKIIKEKMSMCKNHPALLCYSIGNEIPASMVRWIGHKKVEKYLYNIYNIIKEEDPESIVTYVNYPTTEYLHLPFLDFLCFNVYLENQSAFDDYLRRLQNIAGNRPLVMGEIGLDAMRNGEEKQASTLEWQTQSVFQSGCAGLVIFSWTDEWYRGEEEVHDWAFGLTTKTRMPKPALSAVNNAFKMSPFFFETKPPKISVIVCSYNGSRTIRECLESLQKINYPDYEIILINDGSTDKTLSIASEFDIKIITTNNSGLSNARNLGLEKSIGEIIVYLDDDTFPDLDWLSYLALEFMKSNYVAIGGPNISPEKSGLISECVNNAPGAPTHVLLTDRIAEHIPGCNMAFRREKLLEIGGFDPQFRIAGDDVDVCWRLQENGGVIGFSPSAMVWHYRRNTVKGYLKQQYCYGKAEALLEKKWPEKYTNLGHRTWTGRIYGDGSSYLSSLTKSRIYSGVWGSAPFQSIYEIGKKNLLFFTLMPEWYILCAAMLALSIVGLFINSLAIFIPVALLLFILPMSIVLPSVFKLNPISIRKGGWLLKKKFLIITCFLHIAQPVARLWGRIKNNLTPWRIYNKSFFTPVIYGMKSIWCNNWISSELRLENLETEIRNFNPYVYRGGDFDRWDLTVKGGVFGGVRVLMAAEDHAKGTQYLRFKLTPSISSLAIYPLIFSFVIATLAIFENSWILTLVSVGFSLLLMIRIFWDCSIASGCFFKAIEKQTIKTGE
jgi:O-antigen biosynthesis protein